MPKRITLTLSDDLAERLAYLADYYDADAKALVLEILTTGVSHCETAIAVEATAAQAWLAQVEPQGRA